MALGIRPKLVLLSLLILVGVSFGFTALQLRLSAHWVEEDLRERAIAFAREIAATIGDEEELRDSQLLHRQIERILAARQSVLQLDIFALEPGGVTLVASSRPGRRLPFTPADGTAVTRGRVVSRFVAGDAGRFWEVMAPVVPGERVVGLVAAQFSLARADALADRIRRSALALTAASAVIMGLLMTIAVHVVVNRPVRRLVHAMDRAHQDGAAPGPVVRSRDEFGILARHFDDLMMRVREFSGELQRRVKEATAELEQRYREVEALNDALFQSQRALSQSERLAVAGRLMAQVAHEVGTPLHSIAGHLELLRGELKAGQASAETVRRLALVEGEVARVTAIIAQLLDVSRRPGEAPEPVDLNLLVRDTADLVRPAMVRAGLKLEVLLAPEPLVVTGHRHPLQQIVLNLLTNAMDATPRGGRVALRTGHGRSADEAVVEVHDDGPGIPAEVRGRIFEPFVTSKPPGRGTGLGLFISRQIARDHRGRLEARSEVPGTTFELVLPRLRPAA